MECQPLSQLKLSKDLFRIKVRLVRIWDSLNPKHEGEVISMDFVVVDEMDTAMQGTIRSQDITYLRHQLNEGGIYTLANFVVCPNKPSFRVVPNELMLRFTRSTIVTHHIQATDTIAKHKFFFVDFANIATRVYKDTQLSDVIGHVLSVSRIGDTYVKDTLTQKKNLEIQDLSEKKLLVTLWGKTAETFPENIVLSKSKLAIVVLAAMTVRTFMGRTCICSSSATRFYIDPEIPEAMEFRRRIDPLELTTLMVDRRLTTMSPAEEFSDNKKQISDLENLDPKLYQNTRFSCRATIVDVDVSDGWWYNTCNQCKAGLKKFENKYWCDRCCCVQDFATPWYKLSVTVQDESGHASFVMFGSLVAELIGIPCSSLASNPNYEKFTIPPILNGLIGQTYNFRVLLGYRDFRKKPQAKVVKIISEFMSPPRFTHGNFCEESSSKNVSLMPTKEMQISDNPSDTHGNLCEGSSSKNVAVTPIKQMPISDSPSDTHGNLCEGSSSTNVLITPTEQIQISFSPSDRTSVNVDETLKRKRSPPPNSEAKMPKPL